MQDSGKPKITVNDDYIDLRQFNENSIIAPQKAPSCKSSKKKNKSPVRSFCLQNEGLCQEKELINCGLKNLVSSYNANSHPSQKYNMPKRKSCLSENSQTDSRHKRYALNSLEDNVSFKSKSDVSLVTNKKLLMNKIVSSSTPVVNSLYKSIVGRLKYLHEYFITFYADKIQKIVEKIEPVKHKYTMTKDDDIQEDNVIISRKQNSHLRSKSRDYQMKDITSCVVKTPYQNGRRSNENLKRSIDPRLKEKYSILKVPCWKRSWTIPVFTKKRIVDSCNFNNDNVDRQTYLYDDGSEIDSIYVQKKPSFLRAFFPSECLVVLFVMGAACGILLASLLIYIMYGNNILQIFFKPREVPDSSFKSYIKFFSGGLIYIITRFFRTCGNILSIPVTHQEEIK